jgi:membrane-bound lytic murein transglycosylase F
MFDKLCIFSLMFLLLWAYVATSEGADYSRYVKYNKHVEFDPHFKKYTKRYFGPNFDWLYIKAQSIAESNLNKDAVSQVGAEGIMQIMPGTWEEIVRDNPWIKGEVRDARWAIAAGVSYDKRMWNIWKSPRPFIDRLSFTMASYNAGAGNIIKAQKLAEQDKNLWSSVKDSLHKVTGHHSKETKDYVDRIIGVKEVLK